ncbi:MAG TPA: tetratricopeptide repeat protein, partial [Candidatus Krumholzibacterium sp.]|nr:tetratricopeptide repeat protein [Candidatus Krumholzibacterium sp.]
MAASRNVLWLVAAALLIYSPAYGQQTGSGLRSRPGVPGKLDFNRAAVAKLMSQNRYSEAIGLLEPVCRENPDRHDLAELLARCYLRSGRPGEAASFLEERLALAPGRLAFVKELSSAYLDLGQKEKALDLWESLLGAEEEDAGRYGVVASMQWEAGMHDLSIETLRRGAAFPGFFESYMREIIRVQRVIGRHEEAFLTAVELFEGTEDRMNRQPGILLETWREAGGQPRLLARVDSLGSFDSTSGRFFRIMGAILRARAGDFEPASRLVAGSDGSG